MPTLPHDPAFTLSAELVEAYTRLAPVSASMAGVPGPIDGWDDLSPAGAEAVASALEGFQARAAALPPATERYGELARGVLDDFLRDKLEAIRSGDCYVDLNNIDCPLQQGRMVFDAMDTSTREGWEAVATRLATIDRWLGGYREALAEGQRRGRSAARRQALAGREQALVHASERSSFRGLIRDYDASPAAGDAALRARLEAGAEHARAAYRDLAQFLDGYLERAPHRDGFGPERYARAANQFLGLTIDPRETYAWGFEQIRAIEASMRECAGAIVPGASVPEVVAALDRDPAQVVRDPEVFLEKMRERQARALRELDGTHFDIPDPIRRIDVKLAPEGGALGAYYQPPNEDFTRPGTVFYAPGAEPVFTLYSEITTAYHEGFPGHHLQCGLQVYLADKLTRLHRLFGLKSGYAEGWALYAEQLMHELGYLEQPAYVLGMHQAKLFRAWRVVADIGMHHGYAIPNDFDFHPGETWTFEHCVEALTDRCFAARDHAESEATRYLGWAGQAISYKVGERVILELRDEARAALGAAFDPKRFHEAVLGTGSVWLDRLRAFVRASRYGLDLA
jgi:uncharacterized protein (DUF885 family)